MNIFASDLNPCQAAINLDDKRVIKMILESGQLLSTALFLNGKKDVFTILNKTHQKHPCTLWAAQSSANYSWLLNHFNSLCAEFRLRRKKNHKWEQYCLFFQENQILIPGTIQTPFVKCTSNKLLNIDFRDMENPIESYRSYLIARWQKDKLAVKWTNRCCPIWAEEVKQTFTGHNLVF